MERVQTLCYLLGEKMHNNASIDELLVSVRLLESELVHLKNITPPTLQENKMVNVFVAKQFDENTTFAIAPKTTEILQLDEADIEAELDEIKKNAEEKNKFALHKNPITVLQQADKILNTVNAETQHTNGFTPKEINDYLPTNNSISINDILHTPKNEVQNLVQDAPVKDLKKAIGLNDKFRFLNELFKGDEAVYERSLKTINNFEILPEAEFWIRRELKLKYAWNDNNDTVKQFDQLVKRRFASM